MLILFSKQTHTSSITIQIVRFPENAGMENSSNIKCKLYVYIWKLFAY